MAYKVRTADGKTFVSDYHGAFAFGEDSGKTWETKEEARECVRRCQQFIKEKLEIVAA